MTFGGDGWARRVKKGSSYPPNISGNRDPLGWPEIKRTHYPQ